MAEKSLYVEPQVDGISRWHLDSAVRSLEGHGFSGPFMGELRFFDREGALRTLHVVRGEWAEVAR